MAIEKEYTNGEVTVVWKLGTCIHVAECVKVQPGVFDPKRKPWIDLEQARTEDIIATIKKCPSGALSYYRNGEEDQEAQSLETKVEVMENGPLLVYGTLNVTDAAGNTETKDKTTAFCRCGHSQNKPYYDGAHIANDFKG